jgi:hypothetical protein
MTVSIEDIECCRICKYPMNSSDLALLLSLVKNDLDSGLDLGKATIEAFHDVGNKEECLRLSRQLFNGHLILEVSTEWVDGLYYPRNSPDPEKTFSTKIESDSIQKIREQIRKILSFDLECETQVASIRLTLEPFKIYL